MIFPTLKTFSKATMVAFVVFATAGYAMAATNEQSKQNDQTASSSQQQQQQKQQQKQQKQKDRAQKMAARLHDALFKKIDLNDKQESDVQKVMADAREERMAWMNKHQDDFQDIRKEMRAARRDKDRAKARDAREKLVKLMKSAPKSRDTMDHIRDVLSKDQSKQFDQNLNDLRRKMQQQQRKQQQRRREAQQSNNGKNTPGEQNGESGRNDKK